MAEFRNPIVLSAPQSVGYLIPLKISFAYPYSPDGDV